MDSPGRLASILNHALPPAPSRKDLEAPDARPAAVLVPIIDDGREPRVVLTERTATMSRHAGEISFPGGLADPGEDLAATALREAEEEIGIPQADVQLAGALPPVHTHVSGILIVPFVGLLDAEPAFVPSEAEIARVLVFPLAALAGAAEERTFEHEGAPFVTQVFDMDGHVIWGATGRILRSLIDVVESAARPGLSKPGDDDLRAILGEARTVAVVGLSSKKWRPSFEVARYLQSKGYRVIPVNPRETEVLGERAYPSLLDVPEGIDAVDVFRRAEVTPEIAEQSVRVGAKVLWLQDGIVSEEAARIAEAGGLDVIMGVCMKHTLERLEEDPP